MRVAFGTVIYETAWVYKDEFISSLNHQVNCEFDLIIINDDLCEKKTDELEKLSNRNIKIISKPYQMSIAELRIFLLLKSKSLGYDLLILGDFDDIFDSKRVGAIIKKYSEKYGFYYNPLFTLDKHNVFDKLPPSLNTYKDILEYNILGLSNTAINLNMIDNTFIESLKEGNTSIFDWYLYTRLLLRGIRGVLVEEARTYYRIHENNIAGLEQRNEENIKKEIAVKREHYYLLKNYTALLEEKYKQYIGVTEDECLNHLNKQSMGYWWNKIHL